VSSFSTCGELCASDVIGILHETVFMCYLKSLHGETFIYEPNNIRIFVSEYCAIVHIFTNIRCDRLRCKNISKSSSLHRKQTEKKLSHVSIHYSLVSFFGFLHRKTLNFIENWRKICLHFCERPEWYVPLGCFFSCTGLVRASWGRHQQSSYQNGMSAVEMLG